MYETETSPVSTRFARPTAPVYDDDGDTGATSKDVDTGTVSKDGDTGSVSEDETRKYARKSFGEIASPYLSPYVHKSGVLDAEYGLRKVGDRFFIGNSDVTVDRYSDFYIRINSLKEREVSGNYLLEKKINKEIVTNSDLRQYKRILNLTSAHLVGHKLGGPIHISKGVKFRTVIAKLFPQTKQRDVETALRQPWERY